MLEKLTNETWWPSTLPVGLVKQQQNPGEGERTAYQGNGREREKRFIIHNNQESPILKLKQNENI